MLILRTYVREQVIALVVFYLTPEHIDLRKAKLPDADGVRTF